MAEALAVAGLLAVLAFVVVRPRGLPEAVAAVPVAALLVAVGVVPWHAAVDEAGDLGPTLGFLAAVLVLAHLSDRAGVFAAAGALLVGAGRGRPQRLLVLVFCVAAATTTVLSLDATVVLLTPVVVAAAAGQRLRTRPQVYACMHLANSASLLLPVSNLTNLLAFPSTGLSFGRFAAVMALPQAVAIAVEYAVLRRFFRADLAVPAPTARAAPTRPPVPTYAFGVLVVTLLGFGASSLLGISPAWVAAGGALLLTLRVRPGVGELVRAASPGFLLFVLGLAIVVRGVTGRGLGAAVDRLVPYGTSLPALLAVAALGALLANMVNNLPAVLVLLPAAAGAGPASILALLVGVNAGPNLTYLGSLATLLWRRVLHDRDLAPRAVDFLRLGALSVPLVMVGSVVALWAVVAAGGLG